MWQQLQAAMVMDMEAVLMAGASAGFVDLPLQRRS